jgi:hypothetical protein
MERMDTELEKLFKFVGLQTNEKSDISQFAGEGCLNL